MVYRFFFSLDEFWDSILQRVSFFFLRVYTFGGLLVFVMGFLCVSQELRNKRAVR